MNLKIIKDESVTDYLCVITKDLQQCLNELKDDAEVSTPYFSFYTSVASVFSNKIEGENIELDSYMKHKRDKIPFFFRQTIPKK